MANHSSHQSFRHLIRIIFTAWIFNIQSSIISLALIIHLSHDIRPYDFACSRWMKLATMDLAKAITWLPSRISNIATGMLYVLVIICMYITSYNICMPSELHRAWDRSSIWNWRTHGDVNDGHRDYTGIARPCCAPFDSPCNLKNAASMAVITPEIGAVN